jgi:predicted nicotinamide N-methyase
LDDLVSCWSELSTRPQLSELDAVQKPSYVRYTAPNVVDSTHGCTVVTLESRSLIFSSGTTGFRTWEAALHLGTFLCTPEGESIVRGKHVIELGAGTGFLSMFCAKHLGADSVLVTDHNPGLISTIDDCIAYNHVSDNKIKSAIWDWGDALRTEQELRSKQPIHFDVALGADLVRVLPQFHDYL